MKEWMSCLGDDVKWNMGDDFVCYVFWVGWFYGDVLGGDGCVLLVDFVVGIGVSDDFYLDVWGVGVWVDVVFDSGIIG